MGIAGADKSSVDGETLALGLVLKNLDNFDMSTFNGRLILQKTVYLMQAFGVYMGHNFSWYIRGPYSAHLTSVGFKLKEVYKDIPSGRFEKTAQKRFDGFLEFMADKKQDADRLEILASIHFLRKIHPTMSRADIIEKVKNKQGYFTKRQCSDAWNELKGRGMV